jgi:hypothetical protein
MVQQPPGGYTPQPPPPQAPPPGMPPQAPMRPQLDTAAMPIADFVVAGGALFALIWSKLAWFKVTADAGILGKYSATGTGSIQWGAFVCCLLLLLFAGFVIANHFFNFIELQLPVGLIYLGLAGLSLIFVLLGLVIKPGIGGVYGVSLSDLGIKMGMNWIMWILMIIFNGAALGGAFMKFSESK